VEHRSEATPKKETSRTMSYIDTEEFERKLLAFPRKRILFITIRDPKQTVLWCKLGKANDWIRRYSKNYFIVQGTNGGIHFHLIAGIHPNMQPKPVKGIHFQMSDLTNSSNASYSYDECIEREDRKNRWLCEEITFNRRRKYFLRYPGIQQCYSVADMIRAKFKKDAARDKRETAKSKKAEHIQRIISYLFKNLDEPRECEERSLYTDYILVC